MLCGERVTLKAMTVMIYEYEPCLLESFHEIYILFDCILKKDECLWGMSQD